MKQTMRREPLDSLLEGNPAVTRRYGKALQLAAGTLLVLHVGVAASVLPYVYVSDDMANCGARLILDHFSSDVVLLCVVVFASQIFVHLIQQHAIQPDSAIKPPPRRLALVGNIVQTIGGAALLMIALQDLSFLSNPPVIKRHSTLCPSVVWSDAK